MDNTIKDLVKDAIELGARTQGLKDEITAFIGKCDDPDRKKRLEEMLKELQ